MFHTIFTHKFLKLTEQEKVKLPSCLIHVTV